MFKFWAQNLELRTDLFVPFLQSHRHVAVHILLLHVFALVVKLFPLGQPHFDLDQAILEIEPERHYGIPLLADLAEELADLLFVEEEFSHPIRIVVFTVAEIVGGNVEIVQKSLAVFYQGKGIVQVCLARPQRLYLGALEHHPCFELLLDEVIVIGFFIVADQLFRHKYMIANCA